MPPAALMASCLERVTRERGFGAHKMGMAGDVRGRWPLAVNLGE